MVEAESGRRPQRSVPMAAVAAFSAMVLIGAAMFVSSGSSAVTPHQTELLNMWDKPYHTVTTTMLWNAASDDAGSDNSNSDDTAYDTYGNSASLSDDGDDSGDTEDLADNNWGTKSYSSDDNDGIEMPDTRVHSWDSSDSVALKQQLKHMFSKGIDRVSKQIAAKAEDSSKGFFGKWAKVAGKKISAGDKKIGLDSSQAKLYKEAEKSEQKEQAKKAPFIKAVKQVVSKEQKEHHSSKASSAAAHDEAVKAKLKAADKLATKLAKHKHEEHAAKKKAAKKDATPKADPGKIGSKSAVKALKHTLDTAHGKAKLAARKKMAALEQQIKNDFASVTSFAHKVKTSLPPMKA